MIAVTLTCYSRVTKPCLVEQPEPCLGCDWKSVLYLHVYVCVLTKTLGRYAPSKSLNPSPKGGRTKRNSQKLLGTGVQGRDVSPTSPHLGSVGMGMYWDDQLGLARRIRAVGGELVGLNPRESGVHHRYTRLTTLN